MSSGAMDKDTGDRIEVDLDILADPEGAPLESDFNNIETEFTYYFGKEKDGVYSVQYSLDGRLLAVGFGDSGLELLSTETGKLDKELRKHKYGALAVMCIRFSPKEPQLCFAATSDGTVHACNVENTSIHEIVHETGNEINAIDFCADGSAFATAGKDLDIRVYDSVTGVKLMTLAGYHPDSAQKDVGGHAKRIFALKFWQDKSDIFLSGGWDKQLKIWDARSPAGVVRTISGPYLCGDALDIKDTNILTGSWTSSDALQVWDFGSGELIDSYPLTTTPDNGEFVYCCRFCDGDIILAGGSGTRSVQAIHTLSKSLVAEMSFGKSVQAMDSFNGGRQFAIGGSGTQVRMARLCKTSETAILNI